MKKLTSILLALSLLLVCMSCALAQSQTFKVTDDVSVDVPDTLTAQIIEQQDSSKSLFISNDDAEQYYMVSVLSDNFAEVTMMTDCTEMMTSWLNYQKSNDNGTDFSELTKHNGFICFSYTDDTVYTLMALDKNGKNLIVIGGTEPDYLLSVLDMVVIAE